MRSVVVVGMTALLGACTSMPERLDERLADAVSERSGAVLERLDDAAAEQRTAQLLQGTLEREIALKVALAANRDFQAQFAALGVAAAEYHEVLALPNPVFDVELTRPSGGGRPAWEFGLAQSLMALLTRPARRAIAESSLQAREQAALETVLELLHQVERAWVEAVADAELATLLAQAETVTEAGQVAAQALYDVGNVPRIELVRERRLHEETRLRARRAELRALSSQEALVRHLGLWGSEARLQLPERLPAAERDFGDVEELERLAVASSLRLAALEAEVVAAARQARLTEGTALLPHLKLGLHAERERSGDWKQGYELAFDLPLFDQGQGRTRRALATLDLKRRLWWQSAVELRSHSRTAAYELVKASDEAGHVREVLVPLAAELLELTVRDWNAMMAGPFELLDARRSQLDTAVLDVEARRAYWLARLQVEHLRRGGQMAGGGRPHSPEMAGDGARGKGH